MEIDTKVQIQVIGSGFIISQPVLLSGKFCLVPYFLSVCGEKTLGPSLETPSTEQCTASEGVTPQGASVAHCWKLPSLAHLCKEGPGRGVQPISAAQLLQSKDGAVNTATGKVPGELEMVPSAALPAWLEDVPPWTRSHGAQLPLPAS